MDVRSTIDQLARFAAQLGHQVAVDVVRSPEIPDQDRQQRVAGHQNGHHHQRQSPDPDVVDQEHRNRGSDQRKDPHAERVDACGIVDAVGDGQPVEDRELPFLLERPGDEGGALAGQLVDQADRVDLHQVGQRDRDRRDHQHTVHEGAGRASQQVPRGRGAQERMLQRHDRHHDDETGGIQVLVGELANPELADANPLLDQRLESRHRGLGVGHADQHQAEPEHQRKPAGSARPGSEGLARVRHLGPRPAGPGAPRPARSYFAQSGTV